MHTIGSLLNNLVGNLVFAFLTSGIVRAMLKWLLRKALDRRQEVAFWILVPGLVLGLSIWAATVTSPAPRLVAKIERVTVSDGKTAKLKDPSQHLAGALIILAAVVRNAGSPSAIDNWKLEIDIRGTKIETRGAILTGNLSLNEAGRTYTYSGAMTLYHRTEDPIPTGGIVHGILVFETVNPHVTISEVTQPGVVLVLKFDDALGRTHSASTTLPEVGGAFLPIAGIEG